MIEQKFINALYKQEEPEQYKLHPNLNWEQKVYANNQGGDYCLFWTIERNEENSIKWFAFFITDLDGDGNLDYWEETTGEICFGCSQEVIGTGYGFVCGDSELRHFTFAKNGYLFYPNLQVFSQVLKDMHDINLKITEELES